MKKEVVKIGLQLDQDVKFKMLRQAVECTNIEEKAYIWTGDINLEVTGKQMVFKVMRQ